jgi:hypothetical protein
MRVVWVKHVVSTGVELAPERLKPAEKSTISILKYCAPHAAESHLGHLKLSLKKCE